MKNLKCFLIGHYSTYSDSGYPICNRCGAHSYYDGGEYTDESGKLLNDWNRAGYLLMPFRWMKFQIELMGIRLRDRQFIWKIRRRFIDDDLPF